MINQILTTSLLVNSLALAGGYLLGSISTAIIVCRLMGLPDPRTLGSNNPGATNVLRTGSKLAAAITLVGDALKGFLAVLITRVILTNLQMESEIGTLCAGTGAFVGHLYPVFFRFQGGKGVATAFGSILGLSWLVCLLIALSWFVIASVFRYSALAALVGFLLAPLYAYLIENSLALSITMLCFTLLIFWRHRKNIQNLINGTETKIGQKTKI